jgi:hypothetical protein
VMATAVVVTLVTGVDYGVRAVRLRRRPMPSQPAGPQPAGPQPAGPQPTGPQPTGPPPGSSVDPAGEAP